MRRDRYELFGVCYVALQIRCKLGRNIQENVLLEIEQLSYAQFEP